MDPREIEASAWTDARERSAAFAKCWLSAPDRLAFTDAFDAVALGSLAIARDRAVALLSDPDLARRLFAPMLGALAADPLFDPPLRASREDGHVGAILFDVPAARMSATLVSADGLARRQPTSIVVPGHVTVTRYLRTNGARLRRWRIERGDRLVEQVPLHPTDGEVVIHDGRSTAQTLVDADGDVAMLSILLRAEALPIVRAYDRTTGDLLRTASTDDTAARTSVLLTLLRLSGRTDAAPEFEAATHDPASHARWSAMREWLALDTRAALPRLRTITAEDSDTQVRAAASATLDLVARRSGACPG